MRRRPPVEAVPVTVLINGQEIRLLEDGSEYAAWSLREPHADGAGMILQRFEARLREASTNEADKIIAVLFAKNQGGILWSALLMVAAERPEIYASRLWELASNEKMLLSRSVRTDATAAVAAFYPYRAVEERSSFELSAFHYGASDAFHQMEHERWLARLFQAIGLDQLVTDEARAFLATEQGSQPVSNEHWAPVVTVSAVTQRRVLQESGVDFGETLNDGLQIKSEQVKERVGLLHGGNSRIEDVGLALQQLREFHDAVKQAESQGTHSDVIKNAEDMAGDLCVVIFQAVSHEELTLSSADLTLLNEVSLALSRSRREQYGRGSRASVVPALFALCQYPATRESAVARIAELAGDPDVHARVLLASNLIMLNVDASDKMWPLADEIVAKEEDEAVLQVFVAAFLAGMVPHEAARVEGMLLAIAERFPFERPTGRGRRGENLDQSMAHVFGCLYVWQDREASREEIFRWTMAPLTYKEQIRSSMYAVRGAVCAGYINNDPESAGPRARTQALIRAVVEATVARIDAYYQQDTAAQIEQQGDARALAECLSYAVASFYFGTGAFPERNMPNCSVIETVDGKKQFLRDSGETLRRMGDVPVPQVTYQLVQTLNFLLPGDPAFCFGLFADIMGTSGKREGFQLESLGVDAMVELVSQCLAEHESIFRDDALRVALVECVDLFVEAGWPAAVRLAYRIPEALR